MSNVPGKDAIRAGLLAVALLFGAAMPVSIAAEAPKNDLEEEIRQLVCASPADDTQKLLCENEELKRLDAEMRATLKKLVASLPQDDMHELTRLRESQKRFAKVRRLCQRSVSCLQRVYRARLKTLKEWKVGVR